MEVENSSVEWLSREEPGLHNNVELFKILSEYCGHDPDAVHSQPKILKTICTLLIHCYRKMNFNDILACSSIKTRNWKCLLNIINFLQCIIPISFLLDVVGILKNYVWNEFDHYMNFFFCTVLNELLFSAKRETHYTAILEWLFDMIFIIWNSV